MKEIKEAAVSILGQLREVVSQLENKDYTAPSEILNGATIGQHVRHTLEFFVCLMDCNAGNSINYDHRKRDKDIEQDKKFADKVFGSVQDFLQTIEVDKDLTLDVDYGVGLEMKASLRTNLFREVAYNIEHMVHHMALIKIGLKDLASYVKIPDGFGVATSTIRHQEFENK